MAAAASLGALIPSNPQPEPEPGRDELTEAQLASIVATFSKINHKHKQMTEAERVHAENASQAHIEKEKARFARRAARLNRARENGGIT